MTAVGLGMHGGGEACKWYLRVTHPGDTAGAGTRKSEHSWGKRGWLAESQRDAVADRGVPAQTSPVMVPQPSGFSDETSGGELMPLSSSNHARPLRTLNPGQGPGWTSASPTGKAPSSQARLAFSG